MERAVHNEVRLVRIPDRGRGPVGRGSQQQLPLAVLQLLGILHINVIVIIVILIVIQSVISMVTLIGISIKNLNNK